MSAAALVSRTSSSGYSDGLAFRFKLPKGTGLSLRAVDIIGGIPKFRFTTSHNVPSITEEDVAVCIQLANEKKRPEFFYCPFLPTHPFSCLGRHYMHYKPAWLKGTALGKLFAKADWKMKSLHADAMSDENKETFQSWSKGSKLDGLATWENFPREKKSGQVLMTCKSISVDDSKDELYFVGEPEMKISVESSPSYTEYLTENFDSIAYHDENTFLKMKEIVKLMLAAEWLRDKGIQFSQEWINQYTNERTHSPRKPVQISLSDEQRRQMLKQYREDIITSVKELPKTIDNASLAKAGTEVDTIRPKITVTAADESVTDSGIEYKLELIHNEPVLKALTDLNVPVVTKVLARITVDDFDYLFGEAEIDPNEPVIVDKQDGPIKPGTNSWSALFAETMPYPCKVIEGPDSETQILGGGCTTSEIPVQKTACSVNRKTETAHVLASSLRKREKIVPSASNKSERYQPPKNVRTEQPISSNKESREKVGWIDSNSRSLYSPNGELAEQKPSLKGLVKIQQLIGGKEVGEALFIDMYLPSPCKRDTLKDSTNSTLKSIQTF